MTTATAPMRLSAALKLLDRHVESAWRLLERPGERMIVCHPDLCIWMTRRFKLGWRRYVKRGAKRGVTIFSLGWLLFSVRH